MSDKIIIIPCIPRNDINKDDRKVYELGLMVGRIEMLERQNNATLIHYITSDDGRRELMTTYDIAEIERIINS